MATHNYNNEWIFENYLDYPSYEKLAEEHNFLFGTKITTSAIKAHCRKLGLKKPKWYKEYTQDEIDWLIKNYPILGVSETTIKFNEIFKENRTKSAIKNFAYQHSVVVDEEVATANKLFPVHSNPKSKRCTRNIGDLRLECGRWVVKKVDGTWDFASRVIYEENNGEIPKDYTVIFLDNDVNNLNPDNLMAIPRKHLGLLSRYDLRSISKEITLTSLKWCELYELLLNNDI